MTVHDSTVLIDDRFLSELYIDKNEMSDAN